MTAPLRDRAHSRTRQITDADRDLLKKAVTGLKKKKDAEKRKDFELMLTRSLGTRFLAAWIGLEVGKRLNLDKGWRFKAVTYSVLSALFGAAAAAQFILKDED